jgi:hypothetical protein
MHWNTYIKILGLGSLFGGLIGFSISALKTTQYIDRGSESENPLKNALISIYKFSIETCRESLFCVPVGMVGGVVTTDIFIMGQLLTLKFMD